MIFKSFVLMFVFFTSDIKGARLDYTFKHQAGGYLKLHSPATWIDASVKCETEGGVLASPATSQLRDAIKDYVSQVNTSVSTIFTGVHADISYGNFFSMEGVSISKMPVVLEPGTSMDYNSSRSCVAWAQGNDTVRTVKCDDKLPYVCYKQTMTVEVAGCGTLDTGYAYNATSGSCYKFHRQGQTWNNANKKCKAEGAYLAIVNSQLESGVLKDLYAKNPDSVITSVYRNEVESYDDQAFIGIRDWLDGASWTTVKGQSLAEAGFSGWHKGEPNNAGGDENCGAFVRHGTLNDESCWKPLAFICEKDPEILYKEDIY